MKKITLILPDGYDKIVGVTAIGEETRGYHTTTNVMLKGFEVEDNCTYWLLITDGVSSVVKEENNER